VDPGLRDVHFRRMTETPGVIDSDAGRVRRWLARDLAALLDTPRMTVLRVLVPQMLADGVLVRRGRFWYARRVDLESWAVGRYVPAPTASTVPTR
jgi:hypothetical protein